MSSDTMWRSFVRQFRRRIAYAAREAPGQAFGVLSLSLILLTCAALSVRTAYLLFSNYYAAVQRQMSSVTRPAEPRSDLEFPAVAAAVLAPMNAEVEGWSLARRDPVANSRAEGILRVSQQLMETALQLVPVRTFTESESERGPGADSAASEATFMARLECIRDSSQTLPCPGWRDGVKAHFATLSTLPRGIVQLTEPDNASPRRVRYQGQFGIDAGAPLDPVSEPTTLLVPSTFVLAPNLFSEQLPRDSAGAIAGNLRSEILQAAAASHFLEDALKIYLPGLTTFGAGDSSIVQAYFISRRSILRIWPAQNPNDLGVNRYWAAAHYMQQFYAKDFEGRDEYTSPPYIDLGGHGIVRTMCRAVSTFDHGKRAGLFGIVAVDYRLPVDTYLDSLASRNMLFDMHMLLLDATQPLAAAGARGEAPLLHAVENTGRRKSPLRPLWNEEKGHARDELMALVREYGVRVSPAEGRSKLGMLRPFPDPLFILPFGATLDGRMRYLLLQPRTPRLPIDVYLFGVLAVMLLVIEGCLLVWWNRNAKHELERLRVGTFLRNLPIGVIRLDPDGMIIEANQVTEWLLGTTLQQHEEHSDGGQGGWYFRELIDDDVIPASGPLLGDVGRPKSYHVLETETRARLESSTYYAFAKRAAPSGDPRVLLVSGAPIIHQPPAMENAAEGGEDAPADGARRGLRPLPRMQTGGVIMPVHGEMATYLLTLRKKQLGSVSC